MGDNKNFFSLQIATLIVMSQPTQLFLVRHGETLWNIERRFQGYLDSPLTKAGIQQTQAIGNRLQNEQFDVVYSSDLGRAFQTAQAITTQTGQSIIQEKQLREKNLGIFQSLNHEEIVARYPEENARYRSYDPDYIIPEGESARQFYHRCAAIMTRLAEQHNGKKVLVVTHGGVISMFLKHVLGIPLKAPRRFHVLNTSINVFSYNHHDNVWNLDRWGDTCHLQYALTLEDDL